MQPHLSLAVGCCKFVFLTGRLWWWLRFKHLCAAWLKTWCILVTTHSPPAGLRPSISHQLNAGYHNKTSSLFIPVASLRRSRLTLFVDILGRIFLSKCKDHMENTEPMHTYINSQPCFWPRGPWVRLQAVLCSKFSSRVIIPLLCLCMPTLLSGFKCICCITSPSFFLTYLLLCNWWPYAHVCCNKTIPQNSKRIKNNTLPLVLHLLWLFIFNYVKFVDLCAELHFQHSETSFHDFAATGSICNALMISCPVISVGVLIRSFSPHLDHRSRSKCHITESKST